MAPVSHITSTREPTTGMPAYNVDSTENLTYPEALAVLLEAGALESEALEALTEAAVTGSADIELET